MKLRSDYPLEQEYLDRIVNILDGNEPFDPAEGIEYWQKQLFEIRKYRDTNINPRSI